MLRRIKIQLRSSFLFNRHSYLRQQLEFWRWQFGGKPIPVPHLTKQKIIKDYAKQFSLRNLIETGTYLGIMINATKHDFDSIFSIELDPALHERARKKFSNYQHITLFQGDSSDVLPIILKKIDRASLFWLDAHYSGGNTARGQLDTPIMSELRQIFQHPVKSHVILIDDARLFNGEDDYPKLQELKDYVLAQSPNHVVNVLDDVIRIHLRTE